LIKKATLGKSLINNIKKILAILVSYQPFNSATGVVIFRNLYEKKLKGCGTAPKWDFNLITIKLLELEFPNGKILPSR
jgi:hypothetical protein